MKRTTTLYLFLASLLAGCASPAQKPDDTAMQCPELQDLVAAALPREVGSEDLARRLLNPRPGRLDSEAVFSPEAVSEVFGDSLEERTEPCAADPAMDHVGTRKSCNAEGSRLKVDPARGRMTYLNPGRSFAFAGSEENTLGKSRAVDIGRGLLERLGLPGEEFSRRAEARVLMAAGRDSANRGKADRRRAEVHVLIPRQVSGFPVFDSTAKLALDHRGEVARAHISWPEFRLVEGLSVQARFPRESVIRIVGERLQPEQGCSRYASVRAFVAYADSSGLSFGEGQDERAEAEQTGVRYVPSLVVYALPPEPGEDSGEISMAGVQFTLPLFGTGQSGDYGTEK